MAFTLPDLPYSKDDFGDLISAETFDYHHGKHHLAYVNKANELVAADAALQGKSLVELIKSSKGGLFNQVGQIWNHSFYWQCLSPEKQAQLFEPFNRLGLERSAVEGHGIGLALAKRLVELQGGSIGVESKPGEGSIFWIELSAA